MEIRIWQEIDEYDLPTYHARVEVVYDNISKSFERHSLNSLLEVIEDYVRETFMEN